MQKVFAAVAALMAVALLITPVSAQGQVKAVVEGYQEVPAISTPGYGMFTATIDTLTGMIEWELSYSGLESGVLQAHIHFGQAGVNGGVIAFLCSNLNGPEGIPLCPENEGTVTGVIDANSILGPLEQGIDEGELEEALMAILSGVTYVNVHTNSYPAGEIRGQIRRGFGRGRMVGAEPPGLGNSPGQNTPPGHNDPPGNSNPAGHNDPPGNGRGRGNAPGQSGP